MTDPLAGATDAPQLPRLFWLLWAGALINRLGDFVQPFLAIYLSVERGLTPTQVGGVLSLWGIGALAGGPVGGLLADRLGRRRTLLLATFSGAAGMLHMGLARQVWHVALAALLLGFLGPLYRPAQQAVVSDLIAPGARSRAFALMYWAANLGFAFSAVVAGLLARHNFALLFVIDAATTVTYGIFIWRLVPETRPVDSAHAPRRSIRDLAIPFRDPLLVAFMGACLLTSLVFSQVWCTLPLEMGRHGISPERYGQLMGINGVLIVLLQMGVIRLVHNLTRARVLAAATFLVGLGFGLFALASGVPGYAVGIVIWTVGEMGQAPVASTVVADLAPTQHRGAYQGVFVLVFSVSSCLAPLLGTLTLQRFGAAWLWVGCFTLCGVAALIHLALAPAQRRRLAQPAASLATAV